MYGTYQSERQDGQDAFLKQESEVKALQTRRRYNRAPCIFHGDGACHAVGQS